MISRGQPVSAPTARLDAAPSGNPTKVQVRDRCRSLERSYRDSVPKLRAERCDEAPRYFRISEIAKRGECVPRRWQAKPLEESEQAGAVKHSGKFVPNRASGSAKRGVSRKKNRQGGRVVQLGKQFRAAGDDLQRLHPVESE